METRTHISKGSLKVVTRLGPRVGYPAIAGTGTITKQPSCVRRDGSSPKEISVPMSAISQSDCHKAVIGHDCSVPF